MLTLSLWLLLAPLAWALQRYPFPGKALRRPRTRSSLLAPRRRLPGHGRHPNPAMREKGPSHVL